MSIAYTIGVGGGATLVSSNCYREKDDISRSVGKGDFSRSVGKGDFSRSVGFSSKESLLTLPLFNLLVSNQLKSTKVDQKS